MRIMVANSDEQQKFANGCWMLETTIFLPLQKKKVSIQIRSRFCPIWGYQQKIAA
jgi:hypothetical protein